MSQVLKEYRFSAGQLLQLAQGDLTAEWVDAVVNAANSALQHGGGVAGAISRRGGPQIQQESDAWVRQHGPVLHERPAYTRAGNLPCKYVIHAVGPVWGAGDETQKLAAAVGGSLSLADELKLESIAFPAISTGIFGFPKGLAAEVIYQAIQAYFADHPGSGLLLVRIVLYDQPTIEAFASAWHFGDQGAAG